MLNIITIIPPLSSRCTFLVQMQKRKKKCSTYARGQCTHIFFDKEVSFRWLHTITWKRKKERRKQEGKKNCIPCLYYVMDHPSILWFMVEINNFCIKKHKWNFDYFLLIRYSMCICNVYMCVYVDAEEKKWIFFRCYANGKWKEWNGCDETEKDFH